jgi:hypothetical protein
MKSQVITITALALTAFSSNAIAQIPPPTYEIKSGQSTQADGWLNIQTRSVLEMPVAAEANSITLVGRTGKERSAISIAFLGADGKAVVSADGKAMPPLTLTAADLKLHADPATYPDTYLQLNHPLRYFVRPNLKYYKPDHRKKVVEKWDTLPAASDHIFNLELRRDSKGVYRLWMDGQFMQEYSFSAVSSLRVTLAPGASLREISANQSNPTSRVLLPVAKFPKAGAMTEAKLEIDPNAALPADLKLENGLRPSIAVAGLSQFESMVVDDLQSYYWRRNAADSLPEQRMFTVPLASYSHAHILAASEYDPAKVNAFTFRVTRYGLSRGNAVADTIVNVPSENATNSSNAQRVGTVSYGGKRTPLWLLKVPVKNGIIQDILHDDTKKNDVMGTYKYLDVELMDPLYNVEKAEAFPPSHEKIGRAYTPTSPSYTGYDYYGSILPPQNSGVHIFGISLEESAAQMQVRPNIGHQAFYASDKPQFDAKVTADKAGEYSVQWEYADVDGKIVKTDKKSIRLAAGAESTLSAPVTEGVGWYAARFRLTNGNEELIDYRTSFVMLPPDTRKAGLESPFYGWFFNNHGADKMTLDEVGPLLQRLGMRRTDLPDTMPESVTLPKYGFTNATVGFAYRGGGKALADFRDGKITLEEAVNMHEEHIRHHLQLWPSIDRMLVFHESGSRGAPFPSELWGVPATNYKHIDNVNSPEALLSQGGVETPAQASARVEWEKNWPKRIEYLNAMAKMVRAKFPKLKMQYGNDGNSMGILGELFRQKFPREYIDTIASESLGQTMAPERDTLDSMQDGWYVRELARKMGYGDVPITATTEWIGRMTERLGRQKQAEWKVRDGLLALAYGYDTISIGGINDASDGYYYSIWANGGLNERYPTMAPKPAYAAVATLTRVLDRAKHQRFVPTGSTVMYLQEFQRGNEWVYVAWAPRGEREITLTFPNAVARKLTDLYGRESTLSGASVKLKASTSVQYLVSPTKLTTRALGEASFPEDKAKVPEKTQEEITLDSLEVINITSDKFRENASAKWDLGKMVEGDFDIREVNDPEMGKCIEIELKPNRQVRLGEKEYVTLKLAKPITTTAKNAGMWIKGNGSWGEVDFVKNHWGPWADNGNLHMRWPGDVSMNFDGWNFLNYPYYFWTNTTGAYATTVISGLRITFPRTTLVGTERGPVENQKVRIKSIVLF